MIRQYAQGLKKESGFKYRGVEPGRLENFSDAVFALAITLLLISTSPPTSFEQIKRFSFEIVPFSMCIVLIILIWHEHFTFFYRYGLRDGKVIALNTLFLVIVLFYVYPLKFLTRMVLYPIALLFNNSSLTNEIGSMIKPNDIGALMMIYGFGAFAVFMVLSQMYRYAYKQAGAMELNKLERFDTKTSIHTNLLMASVPLLSVVLAFFFRHSWVAGPVAGFSYFLYVPLMAIHGTKSNKQRQAILDMQQQNIEL
jgi:uncharacterized membrane protein